MDSSNPKKPGQPKGSKNRTSLNSEVDEEMKWQEHTQLITKEISVSIENVKQAINVQLSNIEAQFNKAILDLRKDFIDLKLVTDTSQQTCSSIQDKLTILESTIQVQTNKLNELERFSRKNNLRIVGVPYVKDENCIKLSKDILQSVVNKDIGIVNAHITGSNSNNKDQHIIVKVFSNDNKTRMMKNSKKVLHGKGYYLCDYLTQHDLRERKKWLPNVRTLYNTGTKLMFFAGKWRTQQGTLYVFQ